jgi:hypothetical protein
VDPFAITGTDFFCRKDFTVGECLLLFSFWHTVELLERWVASSFFDIHLVSGVSKEFFFSYQSVSFDSSVGLGSAIFDLSSCCGEIFICNDDESVGEV